MADGEDQLIDLCSSSDEYDETDGPDTCATASIKASDGLSSAGLLRSSRGSTETPVARLSEPVAKRTKEEVAKRTKEEPQSLAAKLAEAGRLASTSAGVKIDIPDLEGVIDHPLSELALQPRLFRGELRPHQLAALTWLTQREAPGEEHRGGILADVKGLGRNVEASSERWRWWWWWWWCWFFMIIIIIFIFYRLWLRGLTGRCRWWPWCCETCQKKKCLGTARRCER